MGHRIRHNYRFKPPWWAIALVVIAVPAFCLLSVWQLQRADYKEQLLAAQKKARDIGPQTMAPAAAARSAHDQSSKPVYGRRYTVTGRYDAEHQILLNDQSRGQQLGYRVWTPLVMANGIRVMVNRGWIPKPDDTSTSPPELSAPSGQVQILGYWRGLPEPGLNFGARGNYCSGTQWPKRLNYPVHDKVACQYKTAVADGLLLLDPDESGGFSRDWDTDRVGLRPYVHYIYAAQWLLMGLAALVIFIVVNIRRR